MRRGGKIAIKVAIGVAVVALMGVVIKGWDRSSRYGVWNYDEEQVAGVRAGNHDCTDSLVNRALNYYRVHYKKSKIVLLPFTPEGRDRWFRANFQTSVTQGVALGYVLVALSGRTFL